jgi:hypothetical protein
VSRRIDFDDDPQAPAANSLVPSVNVVVVNDEVRQEFSIVLSGRALSGQPTPSSESTEVRWVPATEVLGHTMDRSMRIRLSDFLNRAGSPVIN